MALTKRSTVARLAGMRRCVRSRAPGAPPQTMPTRLCVSASRRVRRAHGATRSDAGSAKVRRRQQGFEQVEYVGPGCSAWFVRWRLADRPGDDDNGYGRIGSSGRTRDTDRPLRPDGPRSSDVWDAARRIDRCGNGEWQTGWACLPRWEAQPEPSPTRVNRPPSTQSEQEPSNRGKSILTVPANRLESTQARRWAPSTACSRADAGGRRWYPTAASCTVSWRFLTR